MPSIVKQKSYLTIVLILAAVAIGLLKYQFFQFLSVYITVTIMALVYILTTKCYRYTKNDYSLFIGYSFLIVGIVNLIYNFLSYYDINYPSIFKPMVHSGIFLIETYTLVCAPFFIRRRFSGAFWLIGIILTIVVDVTVNWVFGYIVIPKNIIGNSCGIILLLGIGNLFVHHRHLDNSIYYKMASAMILLSIASFFPMEMLVGFFRVIPSLLRLGAYILIYQGTISVPHELIFRELKENAMIDHLTGLYNRHGLMEFAKKEMARAEREGWFVGVLLMDLDRFKIINDRHGHLAGDRIIRQFSDILKKLIRETDIICRLGGDEFVVMLSSAELNPTLIKDRILEAVEQWKANDELAAKIGVSIGIGIKEPGSHKKLEDILKEADHFMYRDKSKKKTVKKAEEAGQYKIFG